jgi:hypothetical protein
MTHHSKIVIIIDFLLFIFCEISLANYAKIQFHLIYFIVNSKLKLKLNFIHLRHIFLYAQAKITFWKFSDVGNDLKLLKSLSKIKLKL